MVDGTWPTKDILYKPNSRALTFSGQSAVSQSVSQFPLRRKPLYTIYKCFVPKTAVLNGPTVYTEVDTDLITAYVYGIKKHGGGSTVGGQPKSYWVPWANTSRRCWTSHSGIHVTRYVQIIHPILQ